MIVTSRCIADIFSDIINERRPGPTKEAENLETLEQFWDILYDEEILNIIVQHTNNKIEEVCLQMIKENLRLHTIHHHITLSELRAFIGILYYAGF